MSAHIEMPVEYWYGKPGAIEHWFWGVFEGGGAKGVAYGGALLAMASQRCWFRGVAGASAGAITSALVAAGLSAEEIKEATPEALDQVRTGLWAGLRRLRDSTGYFPSDKLRSWLDELLTRQVAKRTEGEPTTAVTFQQLFEATGIELNIVAADLSSGGQIVFSHNETPNCAVADAVVASSAIPFAFASRLLHVAERDAEDQVFHHTIVDGGVWSNFPMYVFEDQAFRESYQREPRTIDERSVLGFILDEGGQQAPPQGEAVKFVQSVPIKEIRAREWSKNKHTASTPPGFWSKVLATLAYPFYLLGRFVEWNSGMERGRWPVPRSRFVKNLVHSLDGVLGGFYPWLFALVPCLLVAIGAWEVGGSLVAEQFRVIPATDWTHPISYVSRPFGLLLALFVIALAILIVFATALGVVANHFLLRASRRTLYGLVTTYVAGSGAPHWVIEKKKNIVALPIPEEVTALSFEMGDSQRRELIDSAERATLDKLSIVLEEQRSAA